VDRSNLGVIKRFDPIPFQTFNGEVNEMVFSPFIDLTLGVLSGVHPGKCLGSIQDSGVLVFPF
jgi:hypothetical protein